MRTIEEIKMDLKSYTCGKVVKATPMKRGEYNKLKGISETSANDEPGYLVMYKPDNHPNHPDFEGYISWSPAKAFEDGYRLSETFTDRLKSEMEDLEEKCQKLEDFIQSGKIEELEEIHQNLLKTQFYAMAAYYGAVRTRYELLTKSKEQ